MELPTHRPPVAGVLLFAAITLGPVLGATWAWRLRARARPSTQRLVLLGSLAWIVGVITVALTPLSLRGVFPDVACISIAYVLYCLAAFLGPMIVGRLWLRVPLMICSVLPLVLAYHPLVLFLVPLFADQDDKFVEMRIDDQVCRGAIFGFTSGVVEIETFWRPPFSAFEWLIELRRAHDSRADYKTLEELCRTRGWERR